MRSKFSKMRSKFSKMRTKLSTKLSKTSTKLSKTQSNGRVNLNLRYKPVWDPETRVCSDTPRFSYRVSETAVQHASAAPLVLGVVHARWVPGCGLGGYTGWVLPRTTLPVSQPALAARRTPEAPSEAGPVGPCRDRSGWGAGSGDYRVWRSVGRDGSWDHPSGPVSPCRASLSQDPQNALPGQ